MVFVCARIRTENKVLKPWYARTIVDEKQSLSDLFSNFACGELDQGEKLDAKYQTAQVRSQKKEIHSNNIAIAVLSTLFKHTVCIVFILKIDSI